MSGQNLANNPFAALFGTVSQAEAFSSSFKEEKAHENSQKPPPEPSQQQSEDVDAERELLISNIIEQIFLITLDPDPDPTGIRPARCVFLQEVQEGQGQSYLDMECLEQAVFERLMLASPGELVVNTTGNKRPSPGLASQAGEANILNYLYQSYVRAQHIKTDKRNVEVVDKCRSVTVVNAKMYLQHPEIFGEDIKPCDHFVSLFVDEAAGHESEMMLGFFERVTEEISASEDEGSLLQVFGPALDLVKKKFQTEFSLGKGILFQYADLLCFFTRTQSLAKILLDHMQPRNPQGGTAYEDTVLGAVLSISCLPKSDAGPYEFFDNPARKTKQDHDATEMSIHHPLGVLNESAYTIMYNLLKLGGDVRHRMLEWIGNCMAANIGRAKMWSQHMLPLMFNQMYASDGFFLNLCSVLLRLCQPFSQPCSPKLLKVQPSYCKATAGTQQQRRERNVHSNGLADQTSLVPPVEENVQMTLDNNYNFMTECFFMTHQCLHLGFHVVNQKLVKLNQDLHRIQTVFQEIQSQGAEGTEPGSQVRKQMEKGMTRFFSVKAALTESNLLERCVDFSIASATYLVQLASAGQLKEFTPVSLPLREEASGVLSNIPEFIMENILDLLLFIRRFKDSMYQMAGERLEHLMTMILVFMGSADRVKNPHLRAHMAEVLDALMPPQNQGQSSFIVTHFHREQLFHKHPLIEHLATTLLNVFVSIEMTGQGVEFEQKFNYRRPMYAVLEYMWGIEIHKDQFKVLAEHALSHMEDTDAPLFLRFINLLINDAIFLLDEALSYMNQLKEKQEERDSGAWENLAQQQRQETEMNYRHMAMLARFHNMMANDTIHSLELLTQEIHKIFTHRVLVDRMVAMLNYFLLHLVGPKKRNLKVKNFDEFSFKPQETVSNICLIYLNLGDDESFCRAVSRDGRSYSHELFLQAENVLHKIRKGPEMIGRLVEFAAKVKVMASEQQEEENLAAEAPEEFLDPILGTLMKDPVLLPSSQICVDRATIARHILSDQSDPFNRSPLTMDMVIPQDELRERMEQWLKDNQKKSS